MTKKVDTRRPYSTGMFSSPKGPPPSATSKLGPVSTDRTVATVASPSASGPGDSRTQLFTYLTKAQTIGQPPQVLYNGDRLWARVTLTLETAGPVAIGQQSNLIPVLGGSGVLLDTDVPMEVVIAKGTRLYVAANGVNRIKVKIEADPWLEQLTGLSAQIASKR